MNCIEQAMIIYEICISYAKQGDLLTYRQVMDYLGYKSNPPGHAIRYGLELAWIACADSNLPKLTSIVVNEATGKPTESGFPLKTWERDKEEVFDFIKWPSVDNIDWKYAFKNRKELSEIHGTSGFWTKRK